MAKTFGGSGCCRCLTASQASLWMAETCSLLPRQQTAAHRRQAAMLPSSWSWLSCLALTAQNRYHHFSATETSKEGACKRQGHVCCEAGRQPRHPALNIHAGVVMKWELCTKRWLKRVIIQVTVKACRSHEPNTMSSCTAAQS